MAALQPVLVVGVGGSGVKTLMALRSVLLRHLRALPDGWPDDRLPEAWQLLAIDTEWEQPPDFGAPRLPASSFHSLVPRVGTEEPPYQDLVRPVINRVDAGDRPFVVGSWMPRRFDRPPSRGAGQIRAIGRAVAVTALAGVRDAIAAAHARIEGTAARTELAGIARAMGADAGSSVLPVLVTSVAGGTGAGMFIDVVEAMRAVDAGLASDVQVLLYGPDVFQSILGTPLGAHVPANAIAAISEITAGVWADATTPGTRSLYGLGRLATASLDVDAGQNAFGARYHYLIGRDNLGGEPVASGTAAYWAVADALGGMITDPSILGRFRSYFITNVFNRTYDGSIVGDASDLSIPNESKYLQPFASIGSGRLAVGSERLLEYAVQGLTRSVVERLLWPAFEPAGARADVEEAADRAWRDFLMGSGLDERDSFDDRGASVGRRDQVIEALRRPADAEMIAAAVRRILDEAASGTESQGIAGDEFTRRILGAYERELPHLEAALAGAVAASAREFARGAEAMLLRGVSRAAADHGYAVADVLLGRLEAELRFVGEEQLPTQAEAERRHLDELPSGIGQMVDGFVGLGLADLRHPVVAAVRDVLDESLRNFLLHPIRCRAAARLLLAVRAELVPAIRESLRSARTLLERDLGRETTVDRAGNPYATFPRLGEPATGSSRVGPTEVLLVTPEQYPAELDAAARTTVGDGLADQWRQRFVARTIRRIPLRGRTGEDGTGMFGVDRAWMPADPELRWADGADAVRPQHHAFRTVLEVVDTAEVLLRDRDTAVGRLAARSLREYLEDGGPAERDARAQRFIDGLVAVMRTSVPLTTLNRGLIAAMHPRATVEPGTRIVSTIPVPPGSPLHGRMLQALEQIGAWDQSVAEACGESDATRIDVFQSLGTALGPAAFTTMTAPAWTRWAEVRDDEQAAEAFWQHRRARPLVETLPIAGPQLRRLAAGWYSGLPLGLVVSESRGGKGRYVAVHDPATGGHAPAPHPLFDRRARGAAVLPAVLGALPLALTEAGVEGSLRPLRPYTLLIGAGRDLERGDGAVLTWIAGGTLPPGVTPALGDADASTPRARRDALVAALAAEDAAIRAEVAAWEGIISAEERIWRVTPLIEIAELLLGVVAEVRASVEAVPVPA